MKNFTIIFALGAFASLAMAPTNFWPALFVGLSGLYIFICRAPSPLKAAITGFAFSLGYFGFSLSWIGNALLIEDNPYWWAWPIAVSGLPLALSIFTAAGCYIYKAICKNHNNLSTYLAFTILILASEYARGHMFTGFPWNLYGYSWIDILPIAQIAALLDIYLLTAITIFWASAPAFLLTSRHSRKIKAISLIIILTSFAISYAWGWQRIQQNPIKHSPDYEIIVIQPNIKQSEKWKIENKIPNFKKQIELSKYNIERNTDNNIAYYIVWPETAISQDLLSSKWVIKSISDMLKSYPNEAYLITGALRYEKKSKSYYNSIITINNTGTTIHIYNKSHLVPFGEYMPLSNIFDIAPIVGFTGFKEGSGRVTLELPEGISFSPLICYEIIFPGKTIDKSSPKPNFIVNVTNDAWYEGSAGPYQHLVQSKFRAIESGLPIIRSANTGISAIITPLGYTQNHINQSISASIIGKLPTLNNK